MNNPKEEITKKQQELRAYIEKKTEDFIGDFLSTGLGVHGAVGILEWAKFCLQMRLYKENEVTGSATNPESMGK